MLRSTHDSRPERSVPGAEQISLRRSGRRMDSGAMGRLLTRLRDRPKVAISSPLSVVETRRLQTDRVPFGRRVVVGRVYGELLWIHTYELGNRGSQKVLRARCVPAVNGCTIVGSFALVPVGEAILFSVL